MKMYVSCDCVHDRKSHDSKLLVYFNDHKQLALKIIIACQLVNLSVAGEYNLKVLCVLAWICGPDFPVLIYGTCMHCAYLYKKTHRWHNFKGISVYQMSVIVIYTV